MAYQSNCPEVVAQLEERTLILSFARAEKKNALTLGMYQAAAELLKQAEQDSGVRAVIVTGSDGVFSAGNDIGDFLAITDQELTMDLPVPRFVDTLMRLEKPLIAAVSGLAVGIGTTMLLHCDFVYADDTATFQLPFTSLGVCPEAGSSYLLPRLAGHVKAMEWLLLGKRFSAAEAQADGVINAVVDDPLAAARQTAAHIAMLPAASVRATKMLMRRASPNYTTCFADELPTFAERLGSAEAREALNAFLEKRSPDFSQFD